MKFGIFDHVDDNGTPLGRQYEDRLSLVEAYDRAGFYSYHVAEHHGTPLGFAPSPNVYLTAVAQRTRRLRLGALVYCLPLYHPIRLIEEICMLDNMSGGRLEFGVGRGVSPIEVGFYGLDAAVGSEQAAEALAVIKQGLSSDSLTHHGKYYNFERVPMVMKPVQQPHPPLWYGIAHPDSALKAAANDGNIVCLLPAPVVRAVTDRYRADWQALGKAAGDLPLLGLSRHMVLAESAQEAGEIAGRAYPRWLANMKRLWQAYGVPFPLPLPERFEDLQEHGGAFAGTPAEAKGYIEAQIEVSGANYFVCDIAFGDIRPEEAERTVRAFAQEILPAFANWQPRRDAVVA